jgi:ABC-type branched-subunit amino acid transport system permease subunit
VLRLEQHRLGPRFYLCGLRIHEFALGFAVLAILLLGGVAELWGLTRPTEGAALFGTWLVGKDWRDLFPSKRNTASWSLLPHRVPRD